MSRPGECAIKTLKRKLEWLIFCCYHETGNGVYSDGTEIEQDILRYVQENSKEEYDRFLKYAETDPAAGLVQQAVRVNTA